MVLLTNGMCASGLMTIYITEEPDHAHVFSQLLGHQQAQPALDDAVEA